MSLVDDFEVERPRLLAVAYRLTGSVADAEDAVQESWLRLARQGSTIENLQAWLTRVVSRICLDRLGSAARRRETYVGQWLPEPLVRPYDREAGPPDPVDVVVRDEAVRFGALVVLDRLTPPQRVAFVLHDGFGLPFDEIGDVLGIEAAAARQHASRGRRAAAATPEPVPDGEHDEAVGRLVEALLLGDLDAVVAALHPDVVAVGDANGTTTTALHQISGREKVARFYLGLVAKYGLERLGDITLVRVNGQLGLHTAGWTGEDRRSSSPTRVTAFAVRDGLVAGTFDVANPDKLGGVRL